jgi:murein DD-endopeptidase MepM/ murein hydrolase activator NlpD
MGSQVVRRIPLVLGLLLAALTLGSPGASAPARNAATAQAFAVRITVPGQTAQTTAYVVAPPKDSVAFGASYAYPADGSLLTTGSLTASATADPAQTATAGASAEVSGISLFGGEITIEKASAKVSASAGAGESTGDFGGTGTTGIGGTAAATVGEWATIGVSASTGGPANTGSTKAWRGSTTAFVLRLTVDHGGFPAGTTVEIGYAETNVSADAVKTLVTPAPTPVGKPAAPARPSATSKPSKLPKAPEPGVFPRVPRTRIPKVDVQLTPQGYVFPVYGNSSYTNTFGANRAVVGWHHGEDIFAALGAPVLAVADGVVFSVGWNRIGGWRLWLVDRQGNQFYYAHLSAFSPAAVNGARVRAGTVLGFVGNTGDAQGTPYHLHFEIHPVELLPYGYDGVIPPFPWLEAVRRLQDVKFSDAGAWLPGKGDRGRVLAPQPGAILVQMSDISTASGLDPRSLQRALAPMAQEGDAVLVGGFAPPTSTPPVLSRG